MSNFISSCILVATAAVVTLLLRAIPFWIFGGKKQMPSGINNVAKLLPAAIMSVLVIYCIKGDIVSFRDYLIGIRPSDLTSVVSSFAALTAVVIIHAVKRKTLLSIAVGTAVYMLLIRILPMIFV